MSQKGRGNPSAIFSSGMNSGVKSSIRDVAPADSKVPMENKNRKRDSILHRLNHLSLLINGSGIDLNIELNEEDELNNDSLNYTVSDHERNIDDVNVTTADDLLESLSSKSTKRRSNLFNSKDGLECGGKKPKGKKEVRFVNHISADNNAYMTKEGLLDTFLTLYEECRSNEEYRNDPLIKNFIKKCEYVKYFVIYLPSVLISKS